MAATNTAGAIDAFLAPGAAVVVWLWAEVSMAAERDRKAVGKIIETNAAGVLLLGKRHAHESASISWFPWSSVAGVDPATPGDMADEE